MPRVATTDSSLHIYKGSSGKWQSTAKVVGDDIPMTNLLPFHEYEIRVRRTAVMGKIWSEPSEVTTKRTEPEAPTIQLVSKYTILDAKDIKEAEQANIKFFWTKYYQRNAANTTIRNVFKI